ncbi:MAG: hypothetical protein C4520_15480 [Candidatus Abyssobacteria bacterium SURF_5]|uniref:Uncharacterized protein n=1 Tax=Abyssobacteria bacterium (strain SURF_5) TaxID=2093360 RepID=A0A3A4NHS7_ABYX5|nr:MAG: hypothetical protein C4520_15480 [Candidatus Abyssubacteria bacterium SURF_5]
MIFRLESQTIPREAEGAASIAGDDFIFPGFAGKISRKGPWKLRVIRDQLCESMQSTTLFSIPL